MSTPYPSTRGTSRGGFRGGSRGGFRGNSRGNYQNTGGGAPRGGGSSGRGGYQGNNYNSNYNNNNGGGAGGASSGGGGYQGNNPRGGGSFRGGRNFNNNRGGFQNDNYQPRGGGHQGASGGTRGGFQSNRGGGFNGGGFNGGGGGGGFQKKTPFREKLREWVAERTSEEGQLVKLDFMCVDDTLKGMSNNGYDDGLIKQVCSAVLENFKECTRLDLSNNGISNLEAFTDLRGLSKLIALSLESNNIATIGVLKPLKGLPLKMLVLRGNQCYKIPSDEDVITLCKIFPHLEVLDESQIPPQLRKSGSTLPQINPYNFVEGLSEDNLRKYLINLYDAIDSRKPELATMFTKDAFITYSNSTNEYVDYFEDAVEIEALQKLQPFSRDILNIPENTDTKIRKAESNTQLKSSIISSTSVLKFFNALPGTKHNIDRITSDALTFLTRQPETNNATNCLCVSVHGHVILFDNNGDKHTKSFDTSFILKFQEKNLLISNFIYHIRSYSNYDLEFFSEITQFISKTKLKPEVAQQIFAQGSNLENSLQLFEQFKQEGLLKEQHFQIVQQPIPQQSIQR